ncbi:MAG: DNA-binding protein WhiA [Bacilli bacterium]|nr:DNA-binding protein WhiA [Bacilli bacterium]MDD4408093.1 DNA-binding protein WhiA [Bacilli bacterium]
MTFTIIIKDEVTKNNENPVESLISLHAYLKSNSIITKDKISILIENASVARWIFKLIKSHYNINIILTMRVIKRFKVRNLYILDIKEKKDLIIEDTKNIYNDILESSFEEKIAFLKGIFLSCGSINDPKKNQYHMEFLLKEEHDAYLIDKILKEINFNSKVLKREKEYMVYIKMSENISDFIKLIGAPNALFYFEDIRIYKDHKNMVNRLNNCEQANVEKSMRSSKIILNNINYLEEKDLIDILDERTKEIIYYKKKYPETSLLELAEIVSLETNKKISKSGVNHHFRKIDEIVNKYKIK